MNHYVYIRCSEDKQDFAQQLRTVNTYLTQKGIEPAGIFEEKQHGNVAHEERVLNNALKACHKDDILIVSEFTRITRAGLRETLKIVDKCAKIGCSIFCIKENFTLSGEGNDLVTLMPMMFFSESAKMERDNIRSSTKSGLAAKKDEIEKNGFFISKRSGRKVEKLGNPRLSEETIQSACTASAISRRNKKISDMIFRQTYETASLLRKSGVSNDIIANRLNEIGYKTPKGYAFIGATVSRLIKDGDKLLK